MCVHDQVLSMLIYAVNTADWPRESIVSTEKWEFAVEVRVDGTREVQGTTYEKTACWNQYLQMYVV